MLFDLLSAMTYTDAIRVGLLGAAVFVFFAFTYMVLRETIFQGSNVSIKPVVIDTQGEVVVAGNVTILFDKLSCGIAYYRKKYHVAQFRIHLFLAVCAGCFFFLLLTLPKPVPLGTYGGFLFFFSLFLFSFHFFYWMGCRGELGTFGAALMAKEYDRASYRDGMLYLHKGSEIIASCQVSRPEDVAENEPFTVLIGFIPLGRNFAISCHQNNPITSEGGNTHA